MNEIELIFPLKIHEMAALEYYQEHLLNGENTLHGDSGLDNAKNYNEWLVTIDNALTDKIRSIVFFAFRKSDNKLVGTINVRHPYESYIKIHGHIGYGVRPSERKKGYATMMLKSALEYCKEIGLDKVLLTCDKSNVASAKTIIKCSGEFEEETIKQNGEILQRYWISI